jgi:hypothetical protein
MSPPDAYTVRARQALAPLILTFGAHVISRIVLRPVCPYQRPSRHHPLSQVWQ